MTASDRQAPFAYDGLDRVLHEKARLGIVTALMAAPKGHSFGELARLCALTNGNLSRHLQVLQEAGIVALIKGYDGVKPTTHCRLTPIGQDRFLAYLGVLEQVVSDAAKAARGAASDGSDCLVGDGPALTPRLA